MVPAAKKEESSMNNMMYRMAVAFGWAKSSKLTRPYGAMKAGASYNS